MLGKIVATLILGAKRVNEHKKVLVDKVVPKRVFSWKRMRLETVYYRKEQVGGGRVGTPLNAGVGGLLA